MTEIKKWLTGATRSVARSPIFYVDAVERRHPDRDQGAEFWLITPPDWVNVIALTDDREVVLVRQYRHGTDAVTLEIPGGAVDQDEGPREAAQRELREETGYEAERWDEIGTIEVNPAFMTNRCRTFVASGATKSAEVSFDEHEELAVALTPLGEFFDAIDRGTIQHGIVVAAAYYLRGWIERGGRT